jgi:hypothetical protein
MYLKHCDLVGVPPVYYTFKHVKGQAEKVLHKMFEIDNQNIFKKIF